jgi:hypothetical protein
LIFEKLTLLTFKIHSKWQNLIGAFGQILYRKWADVDDWDEWGEVIADYKIRHIFFHKQLKVNKMNAEKLGLKALKITLISVVIIGILIFLMNGGNKKLVFNKQERLLWLFIKLLIFIAGALFAVVYVWLEKSDRQNDTITVSDAEIKILSSQKQITIKNQNIERVVVHTTKNGFRRYKLDFYLINGTTYNVEFLIPTAAFFNKIDSIKAQKVVVEYL